MVNILPIIFGTDFVTGAFEFHISRQARHKFDFDEAIYQLSGNAILANFPAARRFAQKINDQRNVAAHPEDTVKAGQINAMGLIDEILHLVAARYKQQVNPGVMGETLAWVEDRLEERGVEMALLQFADEFPPLSVYQREQSLNDYFKKTTAGVPNREIILEEMLMLWLANVNPAFGPYKELFDDRSLRQQTAYLGIIQEITTFFSYQPRFGPQEQTLVEMLRSPAAASPHSLSGQLDYIRMHWAGLLGETLLRLLSSLDFIQEEQKATFGVGPGPIEIYDFQTHGTEDEPERFSQDRDWMGNLVLIAKNSYVWLDQLSKKYQRGISRLDQIPDEELGLLARQGITGLWLIGLWQRSQASKRIKHIMGNPEAAASAYSLDDYVIAGDLGGEPAVDDLRQRAWQRGIRLASDMVPNHMGIDSRWVLDHPDWFLGLNHSPFPSYSFNGENLSLQEWTGIFLEDHYYDHSDAAVVFKHVDYRSGVERYIYHGNDGTSMPWNDTAQLDFSKPEVREAVIQTILHVARQFPIIRFDAAMVLAKKHIQRLWYPVPGSGGAIPSRVEFGISKAEFDQLIPQEFWREVVDRVAREAPDTLLLAEAFWMMEGYFVRTLGMHRVYNSAFMHMLRDEDNAKYRQVIKNTIEFNPEILKRYVNFMNNPDEETAVEQFGVGDKYFGVATMMATLPGLPMIGHGQIEGFSEKYGMEYSRAKWEEQPDEELVARHTRQLFPLFHRRKLFAEVENFLLYEFFAADGEVDENVFAYSNRLGEERALVLYHNTFGDTRGWIKTSAAYLETSQGDSERGLIQTSLGDGLALPSDPAAYVIFSELVSGLEFICSCRDVHQKGMFAELFAYQTLVFLDFRVVHDPAGESYGRLAAELNGRGVPNVDQVLQEMVLAPVLAPYRELVNAEMFRYLIDHQLAGNRKRVVVEPLSQAEDKLSAFLTAASLFAGQDYGVDKPAKQARRLMERALQLPGLTRVFPKPNSRNYRDLNDWLNGRLNTDDFSWGVLLGWISLDALGKLAGNPEMSLIWMDGWLLKNPLAAMLTGLGADQGRAGYGVNLVRLLLTHDQWYRVDVGKRRKPYVVMDQWLNDPDVRDFLGVNTFEGKRWFNLEAIQNWLWWMMAAAAIQILADPKVKIKDKPDELLEAYAIVNKIRRTIPASKYDVESLLDLLKPGKKG